jgi:hypothetical protein
MKNGKNGNGKKYPPKSKAEWNAKLAAAWDSVQLAWFQKKRK